MPRLELTHTGLTENQAIAPSESAALFAAARESAAKAQIAGFSAAQEVISTAVALHRQLSSELEQMRADGMPTNDPNFSTVLKHWERIARVINGTVAALRSSGVNVNVAAVAKAGNEPAAVFSKEWDG